MKVVHLTTSSRGGAGIAALRLHHALRAEGVESAFLARDLTIDFGGYTIEDSFFNYRKPSALRRLFDTIRIRLFPSEKDKIIKTYRDLEPQLDCEIASLPFSNYKPENHPLVEEADIINLHWVGGILDYNSFFELPGKAVVWTLHDKNPFKGLFHYEADEERNSEATLLERQLRELKAKAVMSIEQGAIVSPSEWLLKAAVKSGVFEHFKVKTTIANSLEVEVYNSTNRETARAALQLEPHEKVLLFTAAQLDNPRKGANLLMAALEHIEAPISLLILGKGSLNLTNKNVKAIPLGYMNDPAEIANIYAASDLFVLPSLEDNLPNTMLESMAAGTPVLAFATGGMKERIRTGFNGILAEEKTPLALQRCIEEFVENTYQFDREAIKTFAENHFNGKRQAESYLEVYEQLLN